MEEVVENIEKSASVTIKCTIEKEVEAPTSDVPFVLAKLTSATTFECLDRVVDVIKVKSIVLWSTCAQKKIMHFDV